MTVRRVATASSSRRIECVQFLRFLAATLVVLYHSDLQLFRLSNGDQVGSWRFGAAGTDLLFVISGFVMVYISHGKRARFTEFIFRRVARIAPLYWLFTLCMLAAFLITPSTFYNTAFDSRHFLSSLAFLPYTHPVLGRQQPFLVPGWALNEIVFFYLLFGLFLFLSSTRRILAVSLTLLALVFLRWLFPGASRPLDFYGAPITVEFILGMLAALAYFAQRPVRSWTLALVFGLSAIIVTVGVLTGTGAGSERVIFWGLPSGGLLLSAVLLEREHGWTTPRVFQRLGDASYSTYLSHLFTLGLGAKAAQITGIYTLIGPAALQFLLVLGALGVGVLTSVLVERPLNTFVLDRCDHWLKAAGLIDKDPRRHAAEPIRRAVIEPRAISDVT